MNAEAAIISGAIVRHTTAVHTDEVKVVVRDAFPTEAPRNTRRSSKRRGANSFPTHTYGKLPRPTPLNLGDEQTTAGMT